MAGASSRRNDRQPARRRGQVIAKRLEPGERPAATDELETLTAFEPLPPGRGDDADGAGSFDVRPSTRRQVEALDVDEPQQAFARRLLAERQASGFLGGHEAD